MPSPRPMPILPRSAVASSDFRPYNSSPKPSSLNVAIEPAMPKAARPPSMKRNENNANAGHADGHSAAMPAAPMGAITTVSTAATARPAAGGIISTKA